MRSLLFVALTLLCSSTVSAQGARGALANHLEALHAKWFSAFASGDGATMDQIETNDLVLVMPSGAVWPKKAARAGSQQHGEPAVQRTLSDVLVRRYGDAAILTGLVTTKGPTTSSHEATTVVFTHVSGTWKIASAQWTPAAGAE
ncbi:MAG: hypothetical protein NVS1B4_23230 [Gemmatimonadaceae bacterium]